MNRVLMATAAAAVMIGGCTVGPNYTPPEVAVPDRFSSVKGQPGDGITPLDISKPAAEIERGPVADLKTWWRGFQDPTLDQLIDRAVAGNLDLRVAEARIREARALLGVERSGWFPTIDARGGVTRSRQSQSGSGFGVGGTGRSSESTLWVAGFDAGWEIDVFGGTRRAVEAARADLGATEEDRNAVLVSLLAEVATNYVTLRGVQQQLRISFDNIESQRQTLALNEARFAAGITSEFDVSRARAQVAAFEATVPGLRIAEASALHRLAVLTGQAPGALKAELGTVPDGDPRQINAVPMALPEVPVGLPSELLLRRPDIRRAERRLAAATARIGVATADLFPRFSLTGSFGTQGNEAPRLVDSRSIFWSVGPAVSWNLFDGNRIRSNIAVRNERQAQTLAEYERTVLLSFEEVENAVTSYSQNIERRAALARAVEANRRSVELATGRFNGGIGDLLDVLLAQRDLFAAEEALVRSETQLSTDLVAIYKALGGGWTPATQGVARSE